MSIDTNVLPPSKARLLLPLLFYRVSIGQPKGTVYKHAALIFINIEYWTLFSIIPHFDNKAASSIIAAHKSLFDVQPSPSKLLSKVDSHRGSFISLRAM